MALSSRTGAHPLPCGRRVEDLWDVLGSAPDAHVQGCPHCRTALGSLAALAEATRAVYDDESLTPPPTLTSRIMAAVRADVRRTSRLPLPAGEHGPVDVSEQAVAAVLRFAADSVDGVRARRCRLERLEDGRVRVDLSVSVRFSGGTSVRTVDVVRDRVRAVATAHVGLDLADVDVEVEDVWDDEA
jgi:uncharacterized alkaline shock family protein YloU